MIPGIVFRYPLPVCPECKAHLIAYKTERGDSQVICPGGRTDSEFAMVIVVRDAISGFTLYAEKCHSESFENIKNILVKAKEKFGIPSGAISDMRA